MQWHLRPLAAVLTPPKKLSCLKCDIIKRLQICTWAAITRCLSAIKLHFAQEQSLHWQCRLWPFSQEIMPWFLHRAHLGLRADVGSLSSRSKLTSGLAVADAAAVTVFIAPLSDTKWQRSKVSQLLYWGKLAIVKANAIANQMKALGGVTRIVSFSPSRAQRAWHSTVLAQFSKKKNG